MVLEWKVVVRRESIAITGMRSVWVQKNISRVSSGFESLRHGMGAGGISPLWDNWEVGNDPLVAWCQSFGWLCEYIKVEKADKGSVWVKAQPARMHSEITLKFYSSWCWCRGVYECRLLLTPAWLHSGIPPELPGPDVGSARLYTLPTQQPCSTPPSTLYFLLCALSAQHCTFYSFTPHFWRFYTLQAKVLYSGILWLPSGQCPPIPQPSTDLYFEI